VAEQVGSDHVGEAGWKRYPFELVDGDTELLFPQAEGERLAEPYRDAVVAIVDDTADAPLRWWVRP
jgi:hypothetical protein